MERLTTRNIAGVAVYKNPFECERCGETIWRLPDYGNGSPTEKLSAYEDAEEQGLLLRLPCKVGDKLYRITPYAKEPIITTHVLQINIKQFFNEKIIVRIDVMDKILVEKQPTAYDPDKVVQQLEEKTELAFQRYMNCTKNSPCYQRYQEQYLQRKMCLEIVKAGGADAKTDS